MYFEKCKADPSKNITCKSDAEIKSKLENTYADIRWTDIAIEPANYKNPNSPFHDYHSTTVGLSYQKSVVL